MHADPASAVIHDFFGLSRLRNVVDLEAAIVIGAAGLFLQLVDGGLRHVQLLCQLGMSGCATERTLKLAAHARQLLGTAADGGWIALMIDDHEIAHDPHLMTM